MKHSMRVIVTVWAMATAFVFAGQPAQARELTPWACMFAPIQGSYEYVAPVTVTIGPGTVIAIPDQWLYASPAPYGSRGRLILDDAGHVQLEAVADFSGALDTPLMVEGRYAIENECVLAVLFDNGAQLGLRIVDNGETAYLVSTTPGFVLLRPAMPSTLP